MPDFLKGNYKIDVAIEDKADAADSTDAFEKKALSRLGGSICFVSKKGLMWQGEATMRTASRATPEDEGSAPAGSGDKDTVGGAGTKNRSVA
ncbi:MAG TPA: hypothetical protein VMT97_16605 [Terriglobales bacterium]|nr:hypothetical protein [Terriglobales bacterium]